MSAKIIVPAVLLACILGCDRPITETPQTRQQPESFHETFFTSVTPTADGGAYAVSFDSGLWYLRGPEAVKVQFSDLSTNSNGTFLIALEITPLLDGGAYAHSVIDSSFWYLREGTAQRVTEVSSLSNRPISGPVNAFPLYVSERQKRLQAETELEERLSFDDVSPK